MARTPRPVVARSFACRAMAAVIAGPRRRNHGRTPAAGVVIPLG
jgi:hypothetical protein